MTQILRRIIAENRAGRGAMLRTWLRQISKARQSSHRLACAQSVGHVQSALRPYFFSPAPSAQPI